MTKRKAQAQEWPRCTVCRQPLPRDVAEEMGFALVPAAAPAPNVLCKTYALETRFGVVRKDGHFA